MSTHVHAQTCTCLYTETHVCAYMNMYACTNTLCVHTEMHKHCTGMQTFMQATCTRVCTQTHMHTCACVCMHPHANVHVCTRIWVLCRHTNVCTDLHTCAHSYTETHADTCVHAYTHVCVHTERHKYVMHIDIHTQAKQVTTVSPATSHSHSRGVVSGEPRIPMN